MFAVQVLPHDSFSAVAMRRASDCATGLLVGHRVAMEHISNKRYVVSLSSGASFGAVDEPMVQAKACTSI